jgi:hypothetical protein
MQQLCVEVLQFEKPSMYTAGIFEVAFLNHPVPDRIELVSHLCEAGAWPRHAIQPVEKEEDGRHCHAMWGIALQMQGLCTAQKWEVRVWKMAKST